MAKSEPTPEEWHQTAALLIAAMELAAEQQKQLRACGVEPSGKYAELLARYSAFVRSVDL